MGLIRIFLLSLLCTLAISQSMAATENTPRSVQLLSEGWRFSKGDVSGAEQTGFDDSKWRRVSVPHDYSIEGPVAQDNPSGPAGGFFPGGVGWYRQTLHIDALQPGRRSFIVFDGVMANSDVWINGQHLGRRPNGYVSFVHDLTAYLKPGDNIIAVRCDNANEPSLRWYLGAGIYRQVRLVSTGDTHIEPWGTFVSTPKLTNDKATVHVRSSIISPDGGKLALQVRLLDPSGVVLKTASTKAVQAKPGQTLQLETDITVNKPQHWDIDNPVLYTTAVSLLRDGKAVDNEDVAFGIRSFEFNAPKGFFLNGRALKIYGVGLHSDGGAVGAAVPLAVWKRRLTELRKLGVNAIRTAHNAVAPEFLDLCDRMGFLVMDEFFDQWTLAKVPYDYSLHFKNWAERDTADLVKRDRNHASIIIYSIGNEIRDTTQPQVAFEWAKRLIQVHHEIDPTRPVTQALFRPNVTKDYDNGYADLLDVVGQNYREKEILAAYVQKPTRKILGTENTHEVNQWVAVRDHPEYAGQFLWTGVDYLGEAGRWPTIGTGSGLLLSTGLQRPRAFERLSWWSSLPMVKIARRVATVGQNVVEPVFGPGAAPADQPAQAAATARPRFSQPLVADWSPANRESHTETLEIYTNADEIELSLNGQTVANEKRHADATPIVVKLPFAAGSLKAIAKRDGKVVATDELQTAGKAARLQLSADTTLSQHLDDVAHVTVTLVDDKGVRIPDNDTVVEFLAEGEGKVIAVDNGNMQDHDPYQASRRKLYDGNAIAILRANASNGKITVRVRVPAMPDVPESVVSIPVKPAAALVPLRSF
ncbi:glycoside hydrolase family 2 protein [Undibacterium sp. CY18W]|uniref:Glycoside hydrolase family 2 protein n=1 Tax=Undibacterium hunanense TaxID=2762292 RepID=A0ABR6ZQR0_9BURK|nr:glycoside hydrolase family 2 TIM barrel-domain containing protein [Undibacterium hunanense]MBC3917954.1 glycoside hydrolase family 2 protein [Undibacterium hunanense]